MKKLYLPHILRVAVILVVGSILFWGCGNPCVELANKICSCEPTKALQTTCEQNIKTTGKAANANDDELMRCEELNKTCHCEELAKGNLAACGLSYDSGLPLPDDNGAVP